MNKKAILDTGKNCWQIKPAKRVSFLIDGAQYYPALHAAIEQAQRTVFILGWDLDTRIKLIRDTAEADSLPAELGAFISEVLQANPNLEVYILNWDWAMVYSFEREWLPLQNSDWKNLWRLFLELDSACPTGASQHQKVVVIDDQVAFSGGFDLGKNRWDSSEHRPNDSRRCNPDGKSYPPFHDVQVMVEGELAKALGDLCRERWQRATGSTLPTPEIDTNKSAWPNHIQSWFEDIDVGIARTFPSYKSYPECREIEALYRDAINAADDLIYIENQYFSSWSIAEMIIQRLQEQEGPDVVIVLPLMTGGWLEQATMDVLRFRVVCKLQEADKYNRLRLCYPHRDELGDSYISVHAKLAVFDDKLVRVGSANLSNRSMGFDSECDLAIEADNDQQKSTIKRFRQQLLAEHLGLEQDKLTDYLENMSLIALIDERQDRSHTLRILDCKVSEYANDILPGSSLVDPEKTLAEEEFKALFVSEQEHESASKQWWKLAAILAIFLLLAVTWRFTPLNQMVNIDTIESIAEQIKAYPFTPVIAIIVFSLAGLLAFPVTLLIIGTALTFEPITSAIYALMGSLLSAMMGYAIGQYMGKKTLSKLAGASIDNINKRLAEHGILTVITLRIVPVAPFTVINLVAGASHIKARDFFLGTLLGMIPGILAITLFSDSLIKTIKNPEPSQIGLFIGIIALIILFMIAIKKLIKRKGS